MHQQSVDDDRVIVPQESSLPIGFQGWGFHVGSNPSEDRCESAAPQSSIYEADLSRPGASHGKVLSAADFVKEELRKESQAALEQYKNELKRQIMQALHREAETILHSFTSSVLKTVKTAALTPAPHKTQGNECLLPPSNGSRDSRVIQKIIQGMAGLLGADEVQKMDAREVESIASHTSASRPSSVKRLRRKRPFPTSAKSANEVNPQLKNSPLNAKLGSLRLPEHADFLQKRTPGTAALGQLTPSDFRAAELRSPLDSSGESGQIDERTNRLFARTSQIINETQQVSSRRRPVTSALETRDRTLKGGAIIAPQKSHMSHGRTARPMTVAEGVRIGKVNDAQRVGRTQLNDDLTTSVTVADSTLDTKAEAGLMETAASGQSIPHAPEPLRRTRPAGRPPRSPSQTCRAQSEQACKRPSHVTRISRPTQSAHASSAASRRPNGLPGLEYLARPQREAVKEDVRLTEEGTEHLPSQLESEEWENEVARSILALYASSLKQHEQSVLRKSAKEELRDEANKCEGQQQEDREREAREAVHKQDIQANGNLSNPTDCLRVARPSAQSDRRIQSAPQQQRLEREIDFHTLARPRTGVPKSASRKRLLPSSRCSQRARLEAELNPIGKGDEHTRRPGTIPKMIRTVGHTRMVVDRPDGSRGFILIPPEPKLIWFSGSGTNRAIWTAIPGMTEEILLHLRMLEDRGDFTAFIDAIKSLLRSAATAVKATTNTHASTSSPMGQRVSMNSKEGQRAPFSPPESQYDEGDRINYSPDLAARLWRQLVVTVNTFSLRCIELRRYATALSLLSKSRSLLAVLSSEGNNFQVCLDRATLLDLRAFIMDTYAYYYHIRHKQAAAMQCVQQSLKLHVKRRNWRHVAICHLHSSCILAKTGEKAEGLRCMTQVLEMVEKGQLEIGPATAASHTQMVALVAVCYHNLAVLHLNMSNLGEAFICNQNARRLARLSLAYTNRWAEGMDHTHRMVIYELAARYSYVDGAFKNREQAALFQTLLRNLTDGRVNGVGTELHER